MGRRPMAGLLLLALLLGAGCATDPYPPIDPDYRPGIGVDELAARMAEAVDPDGAYRRSRSYFMRQQIALAGGRAMTIEVTFREPDRSSTVVRLDGALVQHTVCDGQRCWVTGADGRRAAVVGKDFARLRLFDAMSSPRATLLEVFARVEFAGEATVGGEPCYVLYCQPREPELEPLVRYVGRRDFLTRKLITVKEGRPYVATIRRYARLAGVMIAAETEADIDGDGRPELMTVTDYRLDVPAPDALFE